MQRSFVQKDGVLNSLFMLEVPKDDTSIDMKHIAEENGLVYIVGCTRKVLFGLGEPPETIKDHINFSGKEAYRRLLEYNTGLLSRSPGEVQITGQFKEAFRRQAEGPVLGLQDYGKLFEWLATDNRSIRSNVTQDLQSAYFETVAQRTPQRPKQSPVVVVIDEDSKGRLSDTTYNILRQLGSFSLNKPSNILITSYDPAVLARHAHEVQQMSERGQLQSNVETVDFETFINAPLDSELYKKSRFVYVCPRCDKYPEQEAKLVKWQDESAAFGTQMILMGGAKSDRKTEGAWQGEHFNLTTPEDITTAQKAKKTENAEIIARGKLAAANCALSRDKGKKPLYQSLGLATEEYERRHGNGQGRRI